MLKIYPQKNIVIDLPKLYFCAHPEDVDKYLVPIAEEILKKQPEIIFCYDDEVNVNHLDDTLRLELDTMQAFVVPITNKFLNTKNKGILELEYAIKKKIPILPLLQDPGLEDVFNNKFGNFQILNKNETDLTAISYEVKLERFLKTHIICESLVNELRKAFCAFVFISYRRNERCYIQELMKTLHSIEEFKDIGFWYDEFLMAGEPFDEIIKKSIDDSDIVLFAVTPNFLEEGNYIQKKPDGEYLYAKGKNKAMIAVELCETDRQVLKTMYEEFPDCVKSSVEEIKFSLMQQLERLAIVHKQNDSVHTYMLGIAYLNGIHVEVDKSRGVKYIEMACNSDNGVPTILPEACKTLADMYYWGNGVSVDYAKSAGFQSEYCKSLLSKKETQVNLQRSIRELYWLADICLQPLDGDRSHLVSKRFAVEAYREVCKRCEKIINRYTFDDEFLICYARSCAKLAALLYEASEMYEKDEDKKIALKECEAMHRKYISILELNSKINQHIAQDDFLDKAYSYYSFARRLPKMAVDEEDRLKKIEESIAFFLKASECEDVNNYESILKIADYYENIAVSYRVMKKYESAINYYKKIIFLYEKIPKTHLFESDMKYKMTKSVSNIIDILITTKRYDEAKMYMKKFAEYNPIWRILADS